MTLLTCHLPQKWDCVPISYFLFCLDLKCAPALMYMCVRRERTDPFSFRPLTAAFLTHSRALSTSPSLFLSAEEVRAATLRPSGPRLGRGPCNQTRAGAVTVWRCDPAVLSKNISPLAMGLHCSVLTFLPVTPLVPHPTDCSIPFSPTCVWSRQLCCQCPACFFSLSFFKLNPDDPVSGP